MRSPLAVLPVANKGKPHTMHPERVLTCPRLPPHPVLQQHQGSADCWPTVLCTQCQANTGLILGASSGRTSLLGVCAVWHLDGPGTPNTAPLHCSTAGHLPASFSSSSSSSSSSCSSNSSSSSSSPNASSSPFFSYSSLPPHLTAKNRHLP